MGRAAKAQAVAGYLQRLAEALAMSVTPWK